MALRLDFFGDEIESVRRFDPATQRTIDRIDGFTLLPASETLLDEDSVKRFRSAYRELFGATATGDPLYQAVSDGRRIAGIDHWLPLFEERLATLFDHLGDDDLIVRDAGDAGAAEARFEAIADYYENRKRAQTRDAGQLPPARARDALSRRARNGTRWSAARPLHLRHPVPRARQRRGHRLRRSTRARDFAPERAQGANVYEAVVAHVAELRRARRKVVLASYSHGSRERLKGLLADHGLTKIASRRRAGRRRSGAARRVALRGRSSSTTASPAATSPC